MKRTASEDVKDKTPTKKSKAVKKMSNLSINYTGVRDGETIIGCNFNQTSGVEMIVKGDTYHPIDECSTNIVRDQFKQFEFFSKMSLAEREKWLVDNRRSYRSSKENHMYDPQNNLKVKFTKIQSPHFFERLGPEGVALLLAKEDYTPMAEVYELFKPKDKVTKANRHNLIFRPENFQIKPKEKVVDSFENGTIIRLSSPDCSLSIDNSKKKFKLDLSREFIITPCAYLSKFAVVYSENPPLIKDDLYELAAKYLSEEEIKECLTIKKLIKPFPPSLLKSLLQKIIRTKCDIVTHDDEEYAAKPFLFTCFITLMTHAGSFNTNKQRFVTGLESALKRLAIIICEDTWIEDIDCVSLLLAGALVRQQNRAWVPTMIQIKRIFDSLLAAFESFKMYEYKTDKRHMVKPIGTEEKPDPYVINFLLLDAIGSMTGDINFYSHLASVERVVRDYTPPSKKARDPVKIPLIHCIDQHSYTSISHFMSFNKHDEINAAAPFKELFSRIWDKVGSINGRRDASRMLTMEAEGFVKETRFAQQCIYRQKFGDNNVIEIDDVPTSFFEFSYTIDVSWLTGLVGPLEVKFGKPSTRAIVVIRTDDYLEMVTIRNPKSSRSNTNKTESADLSPEDKELAVEAAKKLLRAGYPLKHVPQALDLFKGAVVRLVDNVENDAEKKFVVKLRGSEEEVDWEEAVKIKASFPEFEYDGDARIDLYSKWLDMALSNKALEAGGVARDGADIFGRVLARFPMDVIKRLYMYLANYRPVIKLYDISRDGSSTKLDVALLDIGVNHILCAICALFPACLSISNNAFDVKYGPLLWQVRDLIKERIDKARDAACSAVPVKGEKYWAPIPGDPEKPLFDHQQDSVDEMIKKNKANKRGHEIWIDMGLGKTAIMMTYMAHLVKNRRMPKYCVYTCPPSGAIKNAKSEFDRFGIPYRDVCTKNKSGKFTDAPLEPYMINIVAHDHMRRTAVRAQLKKHACDMLFLVDEFHLCTTGDTIRSSIALEISRLSADFIAATGTIVRNDNPSDLIEWLEQITCFHVSAYNYLCAFGALVSKKASTGVIVERVDIMCDFTPEEEKDYNLSVPARLGGTSADLNFRAAIKACYLATDREMVRQITYYVRKEKEIVFVLAQSIAHQERLKELIIEGGKIRESQIFLINKDQSVILKPETKTKYKVVITTLSHVCGYTLTKCRVSIASVYPSNESSRNQYEGRTNRIGQPSKEVKMITVHCGILSYLLAHYQKARSFAAALKEFATEIGVDYKTMITDVVR